MASTPTLEFEKPIFELEKQIDELKKGQWYANVHTDKYPDGEIRGWLTAKK